jgi:beta-mannosidase
MKRDFPIPAKDEDYVYMSQVLQAYGMTKGFEAQRRAKPYNMGTLYWQLNDCWPVISWSSLDNFGNWKALHYKAKMAFENVLVSSKLEGDYLKTFIVNDDLKSYKGILSIEIIDFDGHILWEDEKEITVAKNSSEDHFNLNVKAEKIDYKNAVVIATFDEYSSYFYLAKPKDLALQKAEIVQNISRNLDGYTIELSSTILQKDVFLFTNQQGFFSDNFFDLLPNESKIIKFKTNAQTLDDLQIKTLNEFVKDHKSKSQGKISGTLSNLFNKLKGTS